MTYFKHRKPQEPYQSAFQAETEAPPNAVDEDGDRLYTEEDYGLPADGDAFLPDEENDGFDPFDIPPEGRFAQEYDSLYVSDPDDPDEELFDEDPLSDDLLTEEERQELRRSHWQLLAGLADFAGVILGTAAILLLIALLVSLINWLVSDISQTFTLWQMRI